MRNGGSALQQELAGDAVAVLRQAANLALRCGHGQVTPLHVAAAVLSDAGGPLRAACVGRSPPPPLQGKALELCLRFNAALTRLATVPMFQQLRAPALSNALAAAFRRAQAIQRRRSVVSASAAGAEGPRRVAGAKVELQQLVISILDDPSVGRVLREAGLSTAEVKANVEKAAAVSSSSSEQQQSSSNMASSSTAFLNTNDAKVPWSNANAVLRVLDCMASGGGTTNRSVVVLGESAAAAESVVKAVVDKVSSGELRRRQHERLKNAQFVPFSAASFQHMPRAEVGAWAGDLRAAVRECSAAGRGVVLVLEDLGYAAEAWAAAASHGIDCCYCPVRHAVMELSSLVRGGGGGRVEGMVWLLGFGAYASYRSCRSGQPSLETVLELHPVVVVPDGSLALSLSLAGGVSEISHRGHHLAFLNCLHDGPMAKSYDQLSLANPNSGSAYSNNLVSKSNPLDSATVRRRRPKFTELTAENLKILCSALETRVPRHRDIAPGIASAVLRRRSGVTRTVRPASPATWLLFQGRDSDGKLAMAAELARLVFGSYAEFTCVAVAAAAASELTPGHRSLKRQRSPTENEHGGCGMQMFYEAIRENPHRVVLVDGGGGGAEHDSAELEAGIVDAMASGTVRGGDGGVVSLEDSIVVVCCQVFQSMSSSPRVSSPRPAVKQRIMSEVGTEVEDDGGAEKGGVAVPRFSLDLNLNAIDVQGEQEGSYSRNDMEILNAVDGVFFF